MKKLISILAAVVMCAAYTGCSGTDDLWGVYDDLNDRVSALEQSVADANSNIAALQKLVQALQERVTIDAVTPTATGYTIRFSDGTTAEISNGSSAPTISVRKDADGLYYWTLDGEWLTDGTGAKVRASALDGDKGDKGNDGVTPQIRINDQTKEWEYSLDGGKTWTPTGTVAEGPKGDKGDSFFKSVDTSDDGYVVFTLADGSEIVIPRTVKFRFEIACDAGLNTIKFGTEKSFAVTAEGVADYMITRPDGWGASFDGKALTVKAPAKSNTSAETAGEIAVMVVSTAGTTRIVRMSVEAVSYDLRVLTFEDADYKGGQTGYWSSLIDSPEYGGELLYGDMNDWMAEVYYEWTDTDNTYLCSGTDFDYGFSFMMGGGAAVSNYTLADIRQGDYTRQLSVAPQPDGKGGHNGSENFCVFFDASGIMGSSVPVFFSDGEERVVDHMYIAPTAYLLNSMVYGDSFSAPLGDEGWFAVTATGYDSDDEETGSSTFYLYKDGKAVDNWTKWDLSSLGAVFYIGFRCSGSDTGAYGLNTPAYFAFDDVAVRFEE